MAKLKMIGFLLGVIRIDRITNEHIRGSAQVERFGGEVREAKLRWTGYVQRRKRGYVG